MRFRAGWRSLWGLVGWICPIEKTEAKLTKICLGMGTVARPKPLYVRLLCQSKNFLIDGIFGEFGLIFLVLIRHLSTGLFVRDGLPTHNRGATATGKLRIGPFQITPKNEAGLRKIGFWYTCWFLSRESCQIEEIARADSVMIFRGSGRATETGAQEKDKNSGSHMDRTARWCKLNRRRPFLPRSGLNKQPTGKYASGDKKMSSVLATVKPSEITVRRSPKPTQTSAAQDKQGHLK